MNPSWFETSSHPHVCVMTDYFVVGYVYLVFESEKSVRALLQACTQDLLHPEGYSEYYFKMSSRRMRCKDVSISILVSLKVTHEALDWIDGLNICHNFNIRI